MPKKLGMQQALYQCPCARCSFRHRRVHEEPCASCSVEDWSAFREKKESKVVFKSEDYGKKFSFRNMTKYRCPICDSPLVNENDANEYGDKFYDGITVYGCPKCGKMEVERPIPDCILNEVSYDKEAKKR